MKFPHDVKVNLQVQNNFIKSSGESPACLIIDFKVPIGISL